MDVMTSLSREMFEYAIHMNSIQQASEVLLTHPHVRTMGDILRDFSPTADVRKQLVDGLCQWFPERNREALDRKVRNWLNGENQSISKEDAFAVSRIFSLSLEQANEFLKMAAGEGIHWRNPEDIVWAYSIVQNLGPEESRSLLERANALCEQPMAAAISANAYTADVFEKLQPVLYHSQEELLSFLEAQKDSLGALHNTAYQLFCQFMDILSKGYADGDVAALFQELTAKEKKRKETEKADREATARMEREGRKLTHPLNKTLDKEKRLQEMDGDTELYRPEAMSTSEILETYLYRNLVPVKERGKGAAEASFSAIQRSIRQNWPDEATISKMKSRKKDVTRKVLILLFLATDGSGSDFTQDEDEEEPFTQEEQFLDLYTRMNLMLASCGFQKLDPRNPFDWMILYCISTGDLWESDQRLPAMLRVAFPEE